MDACYMFIPGTQVEQSEFLDLLNKLIWVSVLLSLMIVFL